MSFFQLSCFPIVQPHLPLSKSSNRLIRVFGIVLYDTIIFLGMVLLLVIVVDLL